MNKGFRYGYYSDKVYGPDMAPALSTLSAPVGAAAGAAAADDDHRGAGAVAGLVGVPLAVAAAAHSPAAVRTALGSLADGALEAAFGVAPRAGRDFEEAKVFALRKLQHAAGAPGVDQALVRDMERALAASRDIDDLHASLAMLTARDATPYYTALPPPRPIPGWHPIKGWID
jgi:hypothetical protein